MTPTDTELRMRAAALALLQAQLDASSGTGTGTGPALDAALADAHLQRFVAACVQGHFGRQWDAQQLGWWAHSRAVLIDNLAAQPQIALQADALLLPHGSCRGPLSHDLAALLRPADAAWDEELELDWAVRYWERARKAGLPVSADFGEFWRQLEWTGLQRHLSLLGLLCEGRADEPTELPLLMAQAIKVATRYKPLSPLAQLLADLRGGLVQEGFR